MSILTPIPKDGGMICISVEDGKCGKLIQQGYLSHFKSSSLKFPLVHYLNIILPIIYPLVRSLSSFLRSLNINSNPFYLLRGSEFVDAPNSTIKTATLVSALVRWHQKVVAGKLEPDRPHAGCTSPFGITLGAGRVARQDRDLLSVHPNSKHIVVLHKNQFFTVPVFDDNGAVVSGEVLEKVFSEIMNAAAPKEDDPFVGLLTSLDRDVWAKNRALLEEDPTNSANLAAIDSALTVVNLDDTPITSKDHESSMLLHGENGKNRWFDKHEVTRLSNGKIALLFEHSYSDGMVWNRMLEEATNDVRGVEGNYSPLAKPSHEAAPRPTALKFDVPLDVQKVIEEAASTVNADCSNCDTSVLDFNHFGKKEIKNWKVSPDAAVQLAYQLAYVNLNDGKRPGVYESCATRNFNRGRTEVIRSMTKESSAFLDSMRDTSSSNEAKRQAFQDAAKRHIDVAKLAKMGQGVDRHFMALQAVNENIATHKLFETDLFNKSKNWDLSTSNVSAPFLDRFGFGAVTGDGYGLGYLIHDNDVPVNVTSYKSSKATDSAMMNKEIEKSLLGIKELF